MIELHGDTNAREYTVEEYVHAEQDRGGLHHAVRTPTQDQARTSMNQDIVRVKMLL